jgi:hypothetical protein
MEMHGRPRTVVLDYDGTNERNVRRITLFKLGVPMRVIQEHLPQQDP